LKKFPMKTNTKKFPQEAIQDLFDGNQVDGLQPIKTGDFICENSHETCELIFKQTATGKCYRAYVTRSGGHYSDREYQFDDLCEEVQPNEVTLVSWVPVKA